MERVRERTDVLAFWATIMAVGLGMWLLILSQRGKRGLRKLAKLEKALKVELAGWHPRAVEAYQSLVGIILQTQSDKAIHATGEWLALNIKRSELPREDTERGVVSAATAFGSMGRELGLRDTARAVLASLPEEDKAVLRRHMEAERRAP